MKPQHQDEAKDERDKALASVEANAEPWFEQAMSAIRRLRGWTGTGEDLRLWITETVGEPHHRNAWGALIAQAVRRGLLVRTGARVAMVTRKSHARQTDVYVSAANDNSSANGEARYAEK